MTHIPTDVNVRAVPRGRRIALRLEHRGIRLFGTVFPRCGVVGLCPIVQQRHQLALAHHVFRFGALAGLRDVFFCAVSINVDALVLVVYLAEVVAVLRRAAISHDASGKRIASVGRYRKSSHCIAVLNLSAALYLPDDTAGTSIVNAGHFACIRAVLDGCIATYISCDSSNIGTHCINYFYAAYTVPNRGIDGISRNAAIVGIALVIRHFSGHGQI